MLQGHCFTKNDEDRGCSDEGWQDAAARKLFADHRIV
jgi:hypothetical protein